MGSACDAHQNRPGSVPPRTGFLSATLPESSLQGTSIDLQSALTLLLSRMDKMESNIANVTKTKGGGTSQGKTIPIKRHFISLIFGIKCVFKSHNRLEYIKLI